MQVTDPTADTKTERARAAAMNGMLNHARRVRDAKAQDNWPPMGPMNLLVGERANVRGIGNDTAIVRRLEHGAFLYGPAHDRLKKLGLEWHWSMNLLPACPTAEATFNAHDQMAAQLVAGNTMEWARRNQWSLILAGERVCRSFGVTYEPLAVGVFEGIPVLVIPHPSGRCLWWNEAENLAAARAMFDATAKSDDWDSLG